MASRKLKGKLKVGETSSEQQDENALHAPSTKAQRLTFDIQNRHLMPAKYGNLSSFPAHCFDFSELLRF